MERTADAKYCGIGIRGVAVALDAVVWVALLVAAVFAVGAATGQLTTGTEGVSVDLTGGPAAAALALWLGLATAYHTVLEWRFGKTIGKALVAVRVVGPAGSTPSAGAALVRNLVRPVDWLPAFYVVGTASVALSDRQQRLGDRLAGTAVVR